MRKAGILCAISSLPSINGVGDFGEEAYHFIDCLAACGMKYWQILPLNPLGYGNSPYQPYSSFAMDEIYISLTLLKEEKLIEKVKKFNVSKASVDYEAVRNFKTDYLKEAFSNFQPDQEYRQFIQHEWVKKYALFLTLKKKNQMKPWLEWPKDEKDIPKGSNFDISVLEDDMAYEMFIQYKLYEQWQKLKKYANRHGIEIIGDLPIYVGVDSEDVWSHQQVFLLDENGHPTFIAGVPPDYFSKTGQRWGNPIYDWEYLKKHDFDFWMDRLTYNSKMFDMIRIDHFRAFDTYWKIPVSCPTAVDGEWVEAPGYAFFDSVYKKIPNIRIIAEDLGDLRKEVLELRDYYHLPGMKIIQFEFNPDYHGNGHENQIVYPGTHDNHTLLSWYNGQKKSYKKKCEKYFENYHQISMTDNFLEYTLREPAKIAILPIQDVLNLSDRARMNLPGTIGSPNWEWKMRNFKAFEERLDFLKYLLKATKRL